MFKNFKPFAWHMFKKKTLNILLSWICWLFFPAVVTFLFFSHSCSFHWIHGTCWVLNRFHHSSELHKLLTVVVTNIFSDGSQKQMRTAWGQTDMASLWVNVTKHFKCSCTFFQLLNVLLHCVFLASFKCMHYLGLKYVPCCVSDTTSTRT